MPAQLISQPNPPPDPSLLPDSILDYAVKLDATNYLPPQELEAIQQFRRAADYIAAGLFLALYPSRRANSLHSHDFLKRQCIA
jgi:hypothetical protein